MVYKRQVLIPRYLRSLEEVGYKDEGILPSCKEVGLPILKGNAFIPSV